MKTLKLIFFISFVISCSAQKLNFTESNLVGNWSSKKKVSVRFTNNFFKFSFVTAPDSVELNFSIDDNGNFIGSIGNAKFENCVVKKNRGSAGRKLNLFTDFIVTGKLIGTIFPGDTLAIKEISIPFNVTDNKTSGTIFQLQGMGVYPMADLNAIRINK